MARGAPALLQGDERKMLDQIGFMDIGLATWPSGIAPTEVGGNLTLSNCVQCTLCIPVDTAGTCHVQVLGNVAEVTQCT